MASIVKQRLVPAVQYHPRSPEASPARRRQLAGALTLKGSLPSTKFLADGDDRAAQRARD
ncbi:MAG TPA: hypothetical protein VFB73_01525 [Chloroflexota bacterium]|nr:hypothetical protein [Chloroflexota bacterium]